MYPSKGRQTRVDSRRRTPYRRTHHVGEKATAAAAPSPPHLHHYLRTAESVNVESDHHLGEDALIEEGATRAAMTVGREEGTLERREAQDAGADQGLVTHPKVPAQNTQTESDAQASQKVRDLVH